MEIKINRKHFLLLLGALLFIGVSIIYHANLPEIITGHVVSEEMNFFQINISEKIENMDLKIVELNENLINLKENISNTDTNLLNIKNHVVGGGYERFDKSVYINEDGISIHRRSGGFCEFWGDANCSQDRLIICPTNYTKFQTGYSKYLEGNKKWFLCVN